MHLTRRAQDQRLSLLGPRAIDLTARVACADLTETDLERGVALINRAMDQVGLLSSFGGTLDWLSKTRWRPVRIAIATRDGATTVGVHEQLAPLATTVYGTLVGGVGVFGIGWAGFIVGITSYHSMPLAIGMWGAAVAGTWGAARWLYGRLAARRVCQLASLLDRLRDTLEHPASSNP